MPYTIGYNLTYEEKNGALIEVNIYDKLSYTANPDDPVFITYLTGHGPEPFKLPYIDNDQNKWKPIRGKKAEFNIKSENDGISAKTFATGTDERWLVIATVQATGYELFRGHLVMDDFQQPFLPPTTYTYRLIAIDGLGTLKEQPLVKPDGTNPRGYFKVIEYISWCLQKTGLQLDIVVTSTWMEQSKTTLWPWYDYIYLWSKTFEDKINTSVNCYKALEMIFGYDSTVEQINGKWWISHTDERSENKTYRFLFNYEGTYQSQLTPTHYQKIIGKNQRMKFIEKDALLRFIRPHKYVKLTFKFKLPKEIVDNIDFSRVETEVSSGGYHTDYQLLDWTLESIDGSGPQISSYIHKEFTDTNKTYEKTRYLVMTDQATINHWVKSNFIPIERGDKVKFSVDRKLPRKWSLRGDIQEEFAQVVLFGDDGKYYVFGNTIGETQEERWWTASQQSANGIISGGNSWISVRYNNDEVTNDQWITASASSAPAPVGGQLQIRLLSTADASAANRRIVHFSNIQFEYIPLINGDYSKYTQYSNKVSQAGDYKANIDDEVFIGDSTKPMFLGTLFRKSGSAYIPAENWFAAGDLLNQNIMIPPSRDYMHPYNHLQIFAVWNQCNREMLQLTGSMAGLTVNDYGDQSVPDMNHNFTVDTPDTSTKRFMPCELSYEFRADRGTITLLETVDTAIPKDYASTQEFRYEQ